MKKRKNKAGILLVLLFVCSFTETDVRAADEGITRAAWLQKLAQTFEMTVEEDNYPDDYFSDIGPDSQYYRDIMVTAEFGVADIEAGQKAEPEKKVTRESAVHTLNYCLRYKLEGDGGYTFSDIADCQSQYQDDAQIAVNRG